MNEKKLKKLLLMLIEFTTDEETQGREDLMKLYNQL